jgi:hypothetical protein
LFGLFGVERGRELEGRSGWFGRGVRGREGMEEESDCLSY